MACLKRTQWLGRRTPGRGRALALYTFPPPSDQGQALPTTLQSRHSSKPVNISDHMGAVDDAAVRRDRWQAQRGALPEARLNPAWLLPVPPCSTLCLCSLQPEGHLSKPRCLHLGNRSNQTCILGNRILTALTDLLCGTHPESASPRVQG